jgi:uncharacterized protein
MLKVDLVRLDRERKLGIDDEIEPVGLVWPRSESRFTAPLRVRLEVQKAGADVVVRGGIEAEVEMACRRCLRDVRVWVEEPVTMLFREDADAADAEEVYPLPADRELDLTEPLREQVLLAVPEYTVCEEACRGLCPVCGRNRNEAECECTVTDSDPRWAALRRLQSE